MDYLFEIVVLLLGAMHPGRAGELKHSVPRLKLSYKGESALCSWGSGAVCSRGWGAAEGLDRLCL